MLLIGWQVYGKVTAGLAQLFYYLPEISVIMKVAGIILIIIGIAMLVFRSIHFTQERKVIDLGPVEVNKKEHKTIGWPMYAGGIAVVAGVVMVLADRKRS